VKDFSALQIIFVYKKQENNLRKALIPPCGVLNNSGVGEAGFEKK
jgi:hypothetical protein